MSNFALIGAAGYIAPRHMKAIKETDNDLLAAVDLHDSVGIIDSYFPDASFFTEIERFDRHIWKLKSSKNKIDYFSICTPNYLHDAHIRLALRNDADAICEKPLVIKPENLLALKDLENDTGKKVHTILQLRYHDKIIGLKEKYKDSNKSVHVDLNYITSRGVWYEHSWKGDHERAGGLSCNIGIHFFDMLTWIFGNPIESFVLEYNKDFIKGFIRLERATVSWFLSIRREDLPSGLFESGIRASRELNIDGDLFDFSNGFENLHTVAYKNILNNNSYGIDDAYLSLCIAKDISKGVGTYTY
jgi:UDP-N-acetyl-2-amino-2-deoxyglucuronate dehydrogenase